MLNNEGNMTSIWGGILVGVASLISYKLGQKNALKQITDRQKDVEIAELKRQLAMSNAVIKD